MTQPTALITTQEFTHFDTAFDLLDFVKKSTSNVMSRDDKLESNDALEDLRTSAEFARPRCTYRFFKARAATADKQFLVIQILDDGVVVAEARAEVTDGPRCSTVYRSAYRVVMTRQIA